MRRRRKRENENDLDAEMFDISVIDDVMPKKSRGKRRQAKIARSFSEVRRVERDVGICVLFSRFRYCEDVLLILTFIGIISKKPL